VKAIRATASVVLLVLAACASSPVDDEPGSASTAQGETSPGVVVARDVAVADLTAADVFAPTGADGLPVVVMFHGSEGLRSSLEPLAMDVATSGAVVVVPSWPVITERPPAATTDDVYFEQTAAAVCAVRFARWTAAEYGGNPLDLTVLGHSAGAVLGARVALAEAPPWPGIDCYEGVSSDVDRFVGTAGDFNGRYQFASWIPDVYRPYDVFEMDVTNRDLVVRLFHGGADTNVWVGVSTDLDQHLRRLGIDSDVAYVETAHGDLIEPSTPAGRIVADDVDAIVHGRASLFEQPDTSATMSFAGDRCIFEQSTPVVVGRPLRISLTTERSDVPVWFSIVGFEPGLTDADVDAILADEPKPLDDPPRAPIDANFVRIEPGANGEMTWVIVTDSLRWVAYCMPDASSPGPGAGLMHPASEVVVAQ
jgi:hypothetical protein